MADRGAGQPPDAMGGAGLRVAHCSDIHLDPEGHGGGSGLRDRQREAFAGALKAMTAHQPDLLLLAGDLFDSNKASVETIHWAMETLSRLAIPVVMIPGNHDCLEPGGIYHRHDFNRIANVQLLADEAGEVVRLPQLAAAVWGRGMSAHTPEFRPLHGRAERPQGVRWYLGLGHGLYVGDGGQAWRSSPIRKDEIAASPWDYLALGHHHAAMDLTGPAAAAAYSGSPTDTVGAGATYVIVDLAEGGAPAVAVHVV